MLYLRTLQAKKTVTWRKGRGSVGGFWLASSIREFEPSGSLARIGSRPSRYHARCFLKLVFTIQCGIDCRFQSTRHCQRSTLCEGNACEDSHAKSEAAKFSPGRLNDLKAGVLTTAQRMFKDSKKKGTSLPSLECVLYVVPDGLLSIPHLTLMSLTHGIDLIRLVMTKNQEQLNEMTPYHYRSLHATQKERSKKVQPARKRLDAMVDAIRSQPSEPVLQTWSDALELIRAIFFRRRMG